LRNLHHIGTLREKCTMGFFLSYSFALLASFLLCSTIGLGYHVLRIRGQGKPGTNGDVESAGHRDGDHLKEGGVSTTSSHEQNLPSCRPYPVDNTRSKETAESTSWVPSPHRLILSADPALQRQCGEHALSGWSPDTKCWPCILVTALPVGKGLKLWPDRTLKLV